MPAGQTAFGRIGTGSHNPAVPVPTHRALPARSPHGAGEWPEFLGAFAARVKSPQQTSLAAASRSPLHPPWRILLQMLSHPPHNLLPATHPRTILPTPRRPPGPTAGAVQDGVVSGYVPICVPTDPQHQ